MPGVYEMEEGSRIFQVVERAGGFTERAAQQYLNMAQIVSDGMKIVVPDGESMEGAERYGIDSASGSGQMGGGVMVRAWPQPDLEVSRAAAGKKRK